jgi:8-oxo-dGTP diphosphatase
MGLKLQPRDLHLTGIVSEHGYERQTHWLLFLFEVKPKLKELPVEHREGKFAFVPAGEMAKLKLPRTDVEQIWPLFWQHRGGFFAAHCRCLANGENEWTIEEESRSPSVMD